MPNTTVTINEEAMTAIRKQLYDDPMTNIKTLDGQGVRDSITKVLQYVDEYGTNATSFDGKKEKDYVKKDDYILRMQKLLDSIVIDDTPNIKSENLLAVKAIRELTGPLYEYPEIISASD